MAKHNEKKGCCLFAIIKWFLIAVGAITVLALFGGGPSSSDAPNPASVPSATVQSTDNMEVTPRPTKAPTPSPTEKPTKAPTPSPTPTPATPMEWIEATVRKEYGEDFISVTLDDTDVGKMITIYHVFADNLTKGMRRDMFMFHAKDVLEELTNLLNTGVIKFDRVYIHGRETFIDKYGKESDGDAMQLQMAAKDLKQIVWKNMRIDMLPDIARTYAVHPAFRD